MILFPFMTLEYPLLLEVFFETQVFQKKLNTLIKEIKTFGFSYILKGKSIEKEG